MWGVGSLCVFGDISNDCKNKFLRYLFIFEIKNYKDTKAKINLLRLKINQ